MALLTILAGVLGIGTAVTESAGAEGGSGGNVVTVNGLPLRASDSTRLPGCTLTVSVGALAAGSHTVGVSVTAMDPSGSGKVFAATEANVEGQFSTGPQNLASVLASSFRKGGNGYHLRVSATVDGTSVGAAPFWLACGAVQHLGHSVQVVISVEWKPKGGSLSATPPRGLGKRFSLSGSSGQGSAACSYKAKGFSCRYLLSTEESSSGEAPPVGLRVSGLGTYTIVENNLPRGWTPQLTTVGQFAADPTLRQWTGREDEEATAHNPLGLLPAASGPPTITHVVVNVQGR